MKQGWEIKNFEDCIVKVRNTTKIPKKKFLNDGAYPIISQENEFINGYWDNEDDIFRVEKPLVIFGDHTKKVKYVDFNFVMGADGIKVLQPIDDINARFFFYQIQSLPIEDLGYARHFRLLKKQYLSIPPLDEQKRIVAKLDKCFEAIDKARANVEKNLNNAKELFQNQLNQIFSQKGDGWVEKKLGDCIKLKSGDGLTSKKMNQNGYYPVYGGNGIAGNHDKYNLEGSQVIIGRVGALCGNTRFINEKIWLTDNAFKVSEFFNDFDKPFLTYLLNYKNLRSYARQSAQPVISNSSTKDIPLQFPENVELQKSIVNQLDGLKSQTQSLKSNYQQELDALDELKKSILQKAFNGEL
jgi:type I restriction enzyme, S subunit